MIEIETDRVENALRLHKTLIGKDFRLFSGVILIVTFMRIRFQAKTFFGCQIT